MNMNIVMLVGHSQLLICTQCARFRLVEFERDIWFLSMFDPEVVQTICLRGGVGKLKERKKPFFIVRYQSSTCWERRL